MQESYRRCHIFYHITYHRLRFCCKLQLCGKIWWNKFLKFFPLPYVTFNTTFRKYYFHIRVTVQWRWIFLYNLLKIIKYRIMYHDQVGTVLFERGLEEVSAAFEIWDIFFIIIILLISSLLKILTRVYSFRTCSITRSLKSIF